MKSLKIIFEKRGIAKFKVHGLCSPLPLPPLFFLDKKKVAENYNFLSALFSSFKVLAPAKSRLHLTKVCFINAANFIICVVCAHVSILEP